MRNTYFHGGSQILDSMTWEWSNFASDREFVFDIARAASIHAAIQPTYYFKFSYMGSLNMVQRTAGLSGFPGNKINFKMYS